MRKSCNRHSSALISLLGGFAITAAVAGTPPHLDSSGVNLQPNYPASALPNAESGSLIVNAEITDTGRVRRLLLLHSTGFDDLDRAGIEALFGWRFIPGLENGKPVPAWAKEQVVFAPPTKKGHRSATPAQRRLSRPIFRLSSLLPDRTDRYLARRKSFHARPVQ